jgi:alkanesulfonate monooxygenase SsuD/methylene tetrahydromethanopterin reductase-like flavin-dependent oxidoreductase (luciferase family)
MVGMTGRFGVELHQYLDARTVLEEVRLAEQLGFDAVWLGDSQLIWRELWALMGAAAVSTSRITLGVGVTNAMTRHASVTASAAMTVQELSGNRLVLGIGRGYTAVRTAGMPRASLERLRRYVETVRGLCAGSEMNGMRLGYVNPHPDPVPEGEGAMAPPIYLGVSSGPRALELAGEIGDGVVVTGQTCHVPTIGRLRDHVAAGLGRRADRPAAFPFCIGAAAAIHPEREPALQAVKPTVASYLQSAMVDLGDAGRAARERLAGDYDVHAHMSPGAAHASAVPDEVVPQFALAGTAEDVRRQCRALFEAGVDEITIRPYAVGSGSRADTIRAFAEDVVADVRQS